MIHLTGLLSISTLLELDVPIIKCKYDKLVGPKTLKSHPKNRNEHPADQIDRLAKLIMYQGVRAPIIVSNQSGFIVKGHGTLQACVKNKMKEIPIVYQDFENDEQEYSFLQSDNAIADWAKLNLAEINVDLENLGPDFDIDLLGLKNFKIDVAENNTDQQQKIDQFIVSVHCKSENEMSEIFSELKDRGFECKLIT